jgi:lambda family phage portal protein
MDTEKGSADDDVLPELSILRERSRDLVRNDAHAAGVLGTITDNVVGCGITPQSRLDIKELGISKEKAVEIQRVQEKIWERWFTHADISERLDFYEMQSLVDRQIIENGEIFIMPLLHSDKNRRYSLALDLIEADRVGTPYDMMRSSTDVRNGIKLGDRGEALGYYIRKGTSKYKYTYFANRDNYEFVPAKNRAGRLNVIHLYYTLRPDQTRGVPFFAPALTYFKDLADFMEAEVIAAKIAACFGLVIKQENEDTFGSALANSEDSGDGTGRRIESIYPGMVERIQRGETLEQVKPDRPGGAFEPFVSRILRAISTALGLPYELVAKDFSKTNYSSARAALLEARRYFKMRQSWLARKLCQPVWMMLMEEAYLNGDLEISNFYGQKEEWTRTRWITPGWAWVDPLKEVKAAKESLGAGLTSLADEAAAQGRDWEETVEQIAREKSKIKDLETQYGVKITDSESIITDEDIKTHEEDEKREASGEK